MDSVVADIQESLLQDFGSRLRQMRKMRRLRQLDMASFGLSYKYYQRTEAGQVNPTLLTMHRLASAFGVSVYDFFRPKMATESSGCPIWTGRTPFGVEC